MIKALWCRLFHHVTWYGAGDYAIYHCDKCRITWPEFRTGNERGTRQPHRRTIIMTASEMPRRKFIGISEVWRDNGTGVQDIYFLFVRVWRFTFFHSTWLP